MTSEAHPRLAPFCGQSVVVTHQLAKLGSRVRSSVAAQRPRSTKAVQRFRKPPASVQFRPRARTRCGSTWLERAVRDRETGGSNPLTSTIAASSSPGGDSSPTNCTCRVRFPGSPRCAWCSGRTRDCGSRRNGFDSLRTPALALKSSGEDARLSTAIGEFDPRQGRQSGRHVPRGRAALAMRLRPVRFRSSPRSPPHADVTRVSEAW